MQVTETSADGLKREFRIVVPAGELEDQVASRLDELGRDRSACPGFRPGKVPMQILRRRYGPSVLGEVLESTVQGSSAEAMREHNLRPALPPKVEIVSFSEGADLEYKMSVEILPEIPEPDFADLGIERLVVEVPEDDIDRAIERIAEQQRKSEPVERPAENGDILVVDVDGRVGEEEIPGSRRQGPPDRARLGRASSPASKSSSSAPRPASTATVRVTFPEDYAAPRPRRQGGGVRGRRQGGPPARCRAAIDDELAKAVGLENLAELRQEVRQQMQRDYDAASRAAAEARAARQAGRALRLPGAARHGRSSNSTASGRSIRPKRRAGRRRRARLRRPSPAAGGGDRGRDRPTPARRRRSVRRRRSRSRRPLRRRPPPTANAGPDDEAVKAEYRSIAERRVRLGLLLAEVGRSNNITVTQEEINQAITREARRHPGYERQVLDFYRQNPDALANLRAPIFEDKVVDFIVELAKPAERRVTPQELLALPDPDDEQRRRRHDAAASDD